MSRQGSREGTHTTEAPQGVSDLKLNHVVSGEQPGHKIRGLEILLVIALVALIGAGAAVAGVKAKDTHDADSSSSVTSTGDRPNVAATRTSPTSEPLAGTFPTLLQHVVDTALSEAASRNGFFDLLLLDRVLRAAGEEPVTAAGLSAQ